MNKTLDFDEQTNVISTVKSAISYEGLTRLYVDKLRRLEKSKQEIKNAPGAINSWCGSLRFKIEQEIGSEFGTSFEKYSQLFVNEQRRLGIQKSTYRPRLSLIKKIRNFWLQQVGLETLPEKFGDRLQHFLRLNNYSVNSFWRHYLMAEISYSTLQTWASNQVSPRISNFSIVERIEKHLQLPHGILTSTLRTYTSSGRINNHQKKSPPRKYAITTESTEIEFAGLVEFKTAVPPPFGMTRRKKSIWTAPSGGFPPTALILKGFLERFFGFCCLPVDSADPLYRGLGLSEDKLSLALLNDIEKVEKFIKVFMFARSGNRYTAGTINFIHFLTGFLRKDSGYLYQKPELAVKIGMSDDVEAWQERCLRTRARLLEIHESVIEQKETGGNSYGFGRDPEKFIKEILEAKRPIIFTMRMTRAMLADVKKLSNKPFEQSLMYRDLLLISLLQANPFRAQMFSIMKFGEHLTRKSDGSWWLSFKRHEFKNRQFLKDDYRVRVAPNLWKMIDEYKDKYRVRFCGSDESSYVFLTANKEPDQAAIKYKPTPSFLTGRVYCRTKQFIPGCDGFRMHSFRHIIVTDIVKATPGVGFFLAAKVLHDKLETIEAHYAHLKTSEFFEPYNTLFSDTWNSLDNSDSEPKN